MIDSHCHLNFSGIRADIKNIIKRCEANGVNKLLTINTNPDEFDDHLNLIKDFDNIYIAYGIHPDKVIENTYLSFTDIENKIKNPKIIGIGETGLDFFYNNSDKEKQISSFKKHIEASIKTDVPLIVHSRNAENETFDILNSYNDKNLKILMHCFTGSRKFAEKLLRLNSFFSASGIITFKNSVDLQETFKFLPSDKILIETDSPYLAPVPNRGQKNEPSFIDFTAKKLAEIKKITKTEIVKFTTDNFNKLFFNKI